MRRALAILLVLLTASEAPAGVYRYTYRVKASPMSNARIPQFIVVDTEVELPTSDVGEGDLAYAKDTDKFFKRSASSWDEVAGGAGGGAPTGAKYITQTADSGLSAEQALGALATGILKNTTTTGVLSIAVAGDFPTLNQSTSGNAATATALAANGGNCTGNNFALGVDASGVGECAQPAFSNLSGAATDAQVPNTITVDLATVATTANAGDSATAFFPSGTVEVARGGTGAAPGAGDQALISDSTSAATWQTLPSCSASTGALSYNTTTNAFGCNTIPTVPASPILANANTGDQAANAADTYLTGSSVTIGGRVKAGTKLRWRFVATKTAAGTATPIWNVRFGTAGSTSDTARLTFTGVAQTGAIDTGFFEIEAIVRAVSATATVAGVAKMSHKLATTGMANVAQDQLFQVTSATFDDTSGSLIAGVSVNPGTSGVWTFQLVSVEATNLN